MRPVYPTARLPRILGDLATERIRQVEREGFSLEQDDGYIGGDLALVAACYAMPEEVRPPGDVPPDLWPSPWPETWWKPSTHDRRRELVKAGALILAEIERLDRLAEAEQGERGYEAGRAERQVAGAIESAMSTRILGGRR